MPAEMSRGIRDLDVAVLTNDVAGTPVDIPGAQALEWSVESDSEELRGDNEVIAVVREAKTLTGTIRFAKNNLDAVAALIGGTVETVGTGLEERDVLQIASASAAAYVRIRGQVPGLDGGGYRVVIHKALVTSGPGGALADGEFNIPEVEFSAVALNGSLMAHELWNTYNEGFTLPTP